MRQMFQHIRQQLTAGEDLVLVTVTASSGATPRGAGARMLVNCHGRLCGTIGGGAVEHRSEAIALQVLQEKSSRNQSFSLTRNDVENLGMICGGDVEVFFHYIPASDEDIRALADAAEARFAAAEDFWLVCDLSQGGTLTLADQTHPEFGPLLSRRPQRLTVHDKTLYTEQIGESGRVYIFGGGHVAQELVPVLSHVGFRCVGLDDRPEFADPQKFPDAEQVLLGDFRRIGDFVAVGENDYVCVMTRGHACDTVVQAQVLKCRPYYCGVIGSAAKAAGVRKALREEHGLSEEELSRITTPIGLPIKGKTPAEIAISIAAQMILLRAERNSL